MQNVYEYDEYAWVKDGAIVSYPVYPIHITKRGHPVSMYTPVVRGITVLEKPFHYVSQKLTYDPDKNKVIADQYLTLMSVQTILDKLYEGVAEDVQLHISDIPGDAVELVFSQISAIAQQRLDAFAAQKNYDNIVSLIGYDSSSIPRFQADAQKGIQARDSTWAPLIALLESIVSGAAPIPRKDSDILSVLPTLTWD